MSECGGMVTGQNFLGSAEGKGVFLYECSRALLRFRVVVDAVHEVEERGECRGKWNEMESLKKGK